MSSQSCLSLPESPVVIKNKINNWKILKFDKNDWANEFRNKVLNFRQGRKKYEAAPIWEHLCEKKEFTIEQFFEQSNETNDTWLYFDYKCLKDIFHQNSTICEDIKWSDLQLKNCRGSDSTIWIGNKGAHTPCHMDTYGCNFVAQIFGRKLWVLMPPEETTALHAVRVPYEESSIFSSFNFFTPNNNLLGVKQAYKIILSPGDVLFIPRHWWHYVENLEVAISVNTWIPLEADHESRLEECLIRQYMINICQNLSEDEALQLLNPNEYSLLIEQSLFKTLHKCLENCIQWRKTRLNNDALTHAHDIHTMLATESKPLQKFDIKSYIRDKSLEYSYDPNMNEDIVEKVINKVSIARSLINSYGHPKNLALVRNNLLEQFSLV